jgi:hypothetical protein
MMMSDGPHRSLPMRRGWKRVAEYGDNRACAPEEIGDAIIPALEQDCRDEMAPKFIDALYKTFRDQESSLFKDQIGPQLEALRGIAGHGIGRIMLEHGIQISATGKVGIDALLGAAENALTDRAARGARQVEEHFCRKSNQPRGTAVRARIEEAIRSAPLAGLARQIFRIDPRSSPRATRKQQGLDDGVRL